MENKPQRRRERRGNVRRSLVLLRIIHASAIKPLTATTAAATALGPRVDRGAKSLGYGDFGCKKVKSTTAVQHSIGLLDHTTSNADEDADEDARATTTTAIQTAQIATNAAPQRVMKSNRKARLPG